MVSCRLSHKARDFQLHFLNLQGKAQPIQTPPDGDSPTHNHISTCCAPSHKSEIIPYAMHRPDCSPVAQRTSSSNSCHFKADTTYPVGSQVKDSDAVPSVSRRPRRPASVQAVCTTTSYTLADDGLTRRHCVDSTAGRNKVIFLTSDGPGSQSVTVDR